MEKLKKRKHFTGHEITVRHALGALFSGSSWILLESRWVSLSVIRSMSWSFRVSPDLLIRKIFGKSKSTSLIYGKLAEIEM